MEIQPFKALRFDSAVVGDVGRCVAPPYDVIDEALQDKLYAQSEYNIARISKGRTTKSDGPTENQYTRAGRFLRDWMAKGVLKADSVASIYVYVQDFWLGEKAFQRVGLVALGKLQYTGPKVQPHENTFDAPKADRLNLLRATQAQLGPVFMLYNDPQNLADKLAAQFLDTPLLADFVDNSNVRHRLFAISSAEDIESVQKMMTGKDVVIADGHHRYETAWNYYEETRNPAAQFRMMTFVNTASAGLVILPTHRLVGGIEDFDGKRMMSLLREDFTITEFGYDSPERKQAANRAMLEYMESESARGRTAFGVYLGNGAFYGAVLTAEAGGDIMERLDAVVLNRRILEKALGIDEKAVAGRKNVDYVKGLEAAVEQSIKRIDSAEKQALFFMNPCTIEQVSAVASAGGRMPQKSTFFYPKFFTGLTICKL